FEVGTQHLVAAANAVQKGGTLVGREVQRLVQQSFEALPARRVEGRHGGQFSCSVLYRMARALRQSRLTVRADMSSTAAVSSTDRPPKNRNSTTWLRRASRVASCTSA